MKKHSAKSVQFFDVKGKEHIAVVLGKLEGDVLDLKYLEDGNIVIAYDVPKQTKKSRNFYWK